MSGVLPTLLCLGWCLCWSVWAQLGKLPRPQVTAVPGPLVLRMTSVTIKCQAPPGAAVEAFRIQKEGSSESLHKKQDPHVMKKDTLQIPEMTADLAGQYHCSYKRAGHWSLPSDPLTLVMTGVFDKPSLSSTAGSVEASVTVGTAVSLRCFSKVTFDMIILIKEDGGHPNLYQKPKPRGSGCQAIFPLDPITSTHAGTYRCYGHFYKEPHVWSHPSDPLQLEVREGAEHPGPVNPGLPPETPKKPDPTNPKPTTGVPSLTEERPDPEKQQEGAGRTQGGSWTQQSPPRSSPENPTASSQRPQQEEKADEVGNWTRSLQCSQRPRPPLPGQRGQWTISSALLGPEDTGTQGHRTMSRVLSTFLCLGWCLCWSVWAQLGNLPKPQVTAVPGPLVLKMTPVTIKCQAPPGTEAEAFRIHRGGSSEPLNTEQGSYAMKEGMLQIPQMTTDRAGQYHCFYQHAGQQSLVSDTLTLVMTGAYDKPSLSSKTGSVEASVTVGTAVNLRCFSNFMFDEFVLSREDGGHPNRYKNATLQGHSGRQAIFPLVNITSTQSGTYRCYGHFHENPYVWSNPSDPLKLEVREAPEQTCPTEPKHTTNCEHFDSSESGMTPGEYRP